MDAIAKPQAVTAKAGDARTRFVLTASGPSARGQVAAISRFVDEQHGYIEEFDQFNDVGEQHFFARAVFYIDAAAETAAESMASAFAGVAARFDMQTAVRGAGERPRVLIMVSKLDHCLLDLLYRHARGELAMEITAVASNHRDLAPLAEAHGLRFVHLPVSPETRAEQEAALSELITETASELIVLARYMQILSDGLSRRLHGRVINIHHSFLPGFKGARPYHQAYARGVKLIGATAHFVTPDLDEGPIIEQSVQRVNHALLAAELVATGRDCECRALARAVALYIERRVFLNGARTVVLE